MGCPQNWTAVLKRPAPRQPAKEQKHRRLALTNINSINSSTYQQLRRSGGPETNLNVGRGRRIAVCVHGAVISLLRPYVENNESTRYVHIDTSFSSLVLFFRHNRISIFCGFSDLLRAPAPLCDHGLLRQRVITVRTTTITTITS